jgi:hypothetical protein
MTMNIDSMQLAELLAGIAKAQTAIIDAVERANGGWRAQHLSQVLSVAANMRSAEPRLVDLPARILMRYQGRPAVDLAAIAADLERLVGGGSATAAAASPAAAAPTPAGAAPAAASDDDLDFLNKK